MQLASGNTPLTPKSGIVFVKVNSHCARIGLRSKSTNPKLEISKVGFELIDKFAESLGISMNTVHCKAVTGQGFVGEVPVFLAKPQTYLNLSGESFHADMNLPCGVLRLHHKGGHGSYNGLEIVICHFRGNREFPRLRIGIGKPPGQMDPKAFLLQKSNVTAQQRIDAALQEGVDALKVLLSKGLSECQKV